MNNIDYGSFYRFLVSLGIALMMLPFLAYIFFWSSPFELHVTEAEIAELTETAREVISIRQKIPLIFSQIWVKVICALSCVLGVVFTLVGGINWRNMQGIDDSKRQLEIEELKLKFQPMSNAEIVNKDGGDVSLEASNLRCINLLYEQKIFEWLTNNFPNYIIQKNRKLGHAEFDIIATSQDLFKKDYIVEIRYRNCFMEISEILNLREIVKEQNITYSEETNHSPIGVLILIIPDQYYENTVKIVNRLEREKPLKRVYVKVLKETDLEKETIEHSVLF